GCPGPAHPALPGRLRSRGPGGGGDAQRRVPEWPTPAHGAVGGEDRRADQHRRHDGGQDRLPRLGRVGGAPSHRPARGGARAGRVGPQWPAHGSANGKLLLASGPPPLRRRILASSPFTSFTPTTITTAEALARELEQIRRQGYSEDNEEFLAGVCCLAVPVRN